MDGAAGARQFSEEHWTSQDRERLQLEVIERWGARDPWVRQRRLNAARRRAGLPVHETRADRRQSMTECTPRTGSASAVPTGDP